MTNAEQALPEFYFEFDGKRRKLIPNFKTLIRFEKATGIGIYEPNVWSKAITIAGIIWAGLGGEESGYTFEQVIDKMDPRYPYAKELAPFVQHMLVPEKKIDDVAVAEDPATAQ